MKTWTPEQATAFVSSVEGDRLNAAWQLSLYGLRRGEVLGLRWSDVDLMERKLTVRWTRTAVAGEIVEGTPKTARSARTLPLDDALVAALDALMLRQRSESGDAQEAYRPCPLCGGAHVVANELGQPYHPQWYSDRFAVVVNAAGVPSIRLHDARHSCGSIMHARGVPIADISAWLGHASADFTMRTYVHSQAGALSAAGESLRAAFTSAPPAPAATGL
jgi:integrase